VLAVGDESFQAKCLEKIREMQRGGVAILFVSHSADLTKKVCSRAVVLQHGEMLFIGSAKDAIDSYHDNIIDQDLLGMGESRNLQPDQPITIESVQPRSVDGGSVDEIESGEPLDIALRYRASREVDNAVFIVEIQNDSGIIVFASDTDSAEYYPAITPGTGEIHFTLESLPLSTGLYMLNAVIRKRGTDNDYDRFDRAAAFKVSAPRSSFGIIATPVRVQLESLDKSTRDKAV